VTIPPLPRCECVSFADSAIENGGLFLGIAMNSGVCDQVILAIVAFSADVASELEIFVDKHVSPESGDEVHRLPANWTGYLIVRVLFSTVILVGLEVITVQLAHGTGLGLLVYNVVITLVRVFGVEKEVILRVFLQLRGVNE